MRHALKITIAGMAKRELLRIKFVVLEDNGERQLILNAESYDVISPVVPAFPDGPVILDQPKPTQP